MNKIKILVIEDSKATQARIKEILDGIDIIQAYTLDEAKRYVNSMQFDLILSDLTLEFTNQATTVHYLKTIKNIPIIVLTTETSEKLAIDLISNGVQDFIVKSEFSWDSLVFKIKIAVARYNGYSNREENDSTLVDFHNTLDKLLVKIDKLKHEK